MWEISMLQSHSSRSAISAKEILEAMTIMMPTTWGHWVSGQILLIYVNCASAQLLQMNHSGLCWCIGVAAFMCEVTRCDCQWLHGYLSEIFKSYTKSTYCSCRLRRRQHSFRHESIYFVRFGLGCTRWQRLSHL